MDQEKKIIHNKRQELVLVFCIMDIELVKIVTIIICLRKVILKYSQSVRGNDFRTPLYRIFLYGYLTIFRWINIIFLCPHLETSLTFAVDWGLDSDFVSSDLKYVMTQTYPFSTFSTFSNIWMDVFSCFWYIQISYLHPILL